MPPTPFGPIPDTIKNGKSTFLLSSTNLSRPFDFEERATPLLEPAKKKAALQTKQKMPEGMTSTQN
jgi:hypothetical protein